MKYAFYPGCVARGGTPELLVSANAVMDRLGIEREEIVSAACTGAGVLQERNQKMGDALNVRTFALAEKMGLPIMTICSTCQGVMSQANRRVLRDPEYLDEINEVLAEEGLEYKGTTVIKHFLWVLVEEIGIEELQKTFTKELSGLKFAPFYGCYIVRPSSALGFEENPEREDSLERVIEVLGADVVDFPGKTLCCGFPILTTNQTNAVKMVANHTLDAKDRGADAMVTPCPLCHLNLDGYQPNASAASRRPINLPILHLPQMLGLALGIDPKAMRLNKHIVSTKRMLSELALAP